MGTGSPPGTLREIGTLMLRTLLCSINQKHLIKLVEKGKFVNFNRTVFWGVDRNRPVSVLFSTVKPERYAVDKAKTELLKCVKGINIKNKQKKNAKESNYIHCQACRERMENISIFVEHLNQTASEITYMCSHCGYLRFTNPCALVYHVLTDNYMEPTLEVCLVCGLFCESLPEHLMDSENIFSNKKVRCKLCEFIAFSVCSLKLHLSYHVDELPYVCPECGEYYSFKEDLDAHMINFCFINNKCLYYICSSENCGMIFSCVENFYSHISTEHYERRVICAVCQEMFSAQRDFLAHRTTEHTTVESCSYSVYNHCTLCPNYTFRGMSQQKHLSTHGTDTECTILVYKCQCGFQTRFKKKFVCHAKEAACQSVEFHRPQVLKICRKCLDVRSFNYLDNEFVCEDCQLILQPSLNYLNYYCQICNLVINYSWSAVLDHFFCYHKKIDLLSVSFHTMLIVSKKKVIPGRYTSPRSILETDVQFINNLIKDLLGIVANTDPPTAGLRIKVRSPTSINASLSTSNLDDSPSTSEQQTTAPQKCTKIVRKDIFFCRKCNFTSCDKSEMADHTKIHYPSEFKCSECGRTFKTSSARNSHLSKDHHLLPHD